MTWAFYRGYPHPTYCLFIKPQPSTLATGTSSSTIREHLQDGVCLCISALWSPEHILNIWLERQSAVTFPILGLTATSIKLPRQLIQWSDLIIWGHSQQQAGTIHAEALSNPLQRHMNPRASTKLPESGPPWQTLKNFLTLFPFLVSFEQAILFGWGGSESSKEIRAFLLLSVCLLLGNIS